MSETTPTGHVADKRVEPPFSGPLAEFERWLYDILYSKIPFKFPKSVQDVLVQFGPWIALVIALLSLPAIFTIFGASTFLSMYGAALGVGFTPMYYVGIAVLAVQVVVTLMAISPLLKHQRRGWLLLFYATTISVVYSLINSLSYGVFAIAGLLWGIVGAAIGYYVLFQIRAHYKA